MSSTHRWPEHIEPDTDWPRAKLYEIRKIMGLTQKEMGIVLGLSLRGYQDLEAGISRVRKHHVWAAYYAAMRQAIVTKQIEICPPEAQMDALEFAALLKEEKHSSKLEVKGKRAESLPILFGKILNSAEKEYGLRDKSWTILGIEYHEEGPCIWFPKLDGGKTLTLRLSIGAERNIDKACYQLAQLAIYLLSPSGCLVSPVLETGMSILFAERMVRQHGYRRIVKKGTKFEAARDRVREAFGDDDNLAAAIRTLRNIQPSFVALTPRLLRMVVPNMDIKYAELLCREFRSLELSELTL